MTTSGLAAASHGGSWLLVGDAGGRVAAVALVVDVVGVAGVAAAAVGRAADEVDAGVAGGLQLVPEHGPPAAGPGGDRVAERHDPDRGGGREAGWAADERGGSRGEASRDRQGRR